MTCDLILNEPYIMPGWGCCQCKHYNGLQRKNCKNCGHECCNLTKPLLEAFDLCNNCGVPRGARHQGHANGEIFGGGPQTQFTLADIDEKGSHP